MRKCRCCDVRVVERIIHCGFCGDSVDQKDCKTKYGKYFHVACFRDFKNFYSNLFTVDALSRHEVRLFRNHILTLMIMRKDLRLAKKQWSLLVSNKATPLELKNELLPLVVN